MLCPDQALVLAAQQRWQHPATAEFYALRSTIDELVFAQVKQQMGFRRWTLRGLENVRTQWCVLAITWNLKVLLRHWGRGPGPSSFALIRRLRARLPIHALAAA